MICMPKPSWCVLTVALWPQKECWTKIHSEEQVGMWLRLAVSVVRFVSCVS